MSCFVRTINQRSQNGRPQTECSPQTCLVWPTQCFKNRRFPILKNLDFHPLKTQKIWQLSSLPTGSHQLRLSRSSFLRESLISSTHRTSHQPSTAVLHPPHASLSPSNEKCCINAAPSPSSWNQRAVAFKSTPPAHILSLTYIPPPSFSHVSTFCRYLSWGPLCVLILSPQRWRNGAHKDSPLLVLPKREKHWTLVFIDC